jgi:hypothetical protein
VALFLVLAVLGIANLHYQVLQEEDALLQIHGSAYQSYCSRTPRYMGAAALASTVGLAPRPNRGGVGDPDRSAVADPDGDGC